MTSTFGFKELAPRHPSPRERDEQRQRDADRQFNEAKHKIAAIIRDYNAARREDLPVDPHAYFEGGELVIPQRDGESIHLARILHEQTGLDVRLTRPARVYVPGYGTANRSTFAVETVTIFATASGRDPHADRGPDSAGVATSPTKPNPPIEDRLIEPVIPRIGPIGAPEAYVPRVAPPHPQRR